MRPVVKNQMEYHTVIRETPIIEMAEKTVAVPQVEVREVIQEVPQVVGLSGEASAECGVQGGRQEFSQTCLPGRRNDLDVLQTLLQETLREEIVERPEQRPQVAIYMWVVSMST